MRIAPIAVPLALVVGCTIQTGAPPPANPPPPAATAAPAPPPPAATTAAPATGPVVGAPTTSSTDPLPQQPVLQELPMPTATAAGTQAGVATGQPPGLHPGAPPAYWIWREANGWWHVRTTSQKGMPHHFWGRVHAVLGDIAEVRATRIEFNDRIKMTPKNVLFSFATAGHLDGFDFRTAKGNECVTFNLHNNGEGTFVGQSQAKPPSNHFTICP